MTGWWITPANDYATTQRLPVGAFLGVTVLTVTKTTDILHRNGFEVRPRALINGFFFPEQFTGSDVPDSGSLRCCIGGIF